MRLTAEENSLIRGLKVAREELPTLAHWYPMVVSDDPLGVWWRHLGSAPLTDAFFKDSFLDQASADRRVCQTPLNQLGDWPDSVPPTAFIFHVSRCGSTLLTQMLATLSRCIVLSEPPVLDSLFRLIDQEAGRLDASTVLRQVIAALGQRRSGDEQHLFIKLDSWHVPWIPLLRAAFPKALFLFMYRNPEEVMASHRRQRGPQMVPGLLETPRLRTEVPGLMPADLDGYCAGVLQAIFDAALRLSGASDADAALVLVNHSQLPEVVWSKLLPLFGVHCNQAELRALQGRAAFHSKHRHQKYEGDTDSVEPASPLWKSALETSLWSCYEQLEALRLRQFLDGKMPSSAMM
ncbi:MAG: hypothetical protein KF740_00580 [Ramlibacter sp.]|nr:hypothetical protein [Ramlibacter sp.]